jgi:yecA family protein
MARTHSSRTETVIRPPDVSSATAPSFSDVDKERLGRWLDDPRWPKGTMGLSKLDGYLTALLVWPVGLATGAWLPRLWNDSGWRIPPMLQKAEDFADFIGLITAYLHQIDAALSGPAPTFSPTLCPSSRSKKPEFSATEWSAGFRVALGLSEQGGHAVPPASRSAAESIARLPGRREFQDRTTDAAAIRAAVLILVAARMHRGPLGALPAQSKVHRREANTAAIAHHSSIASTVALT